MEINLKGFVDLAWLPRWGKEREWGTAQMLGLKNQILESSVIPRGYGEMRTGQESCQGWGWLKAGCLLDSQAEGWGCEVAWLAQLVSYSAQGSCGSCSQGWRMSQRAQWMVDPEGE